MLRMDADRATTLTRVRARLEAVSANRPSDVIAASFSAKGAKTVGQILDAAQQVFIEDGHAGLSMRKVAERAGLSVGNVTYYFASKRALLAATLNEALSFYAREHLRQLDAVALDPMETLLNIVEFYVADGRRANRFFFQMWGYAGSDEAARTLVRDLYRSIGYMIYHLVRAANPTLSHAEARRAVLLIFSLEEGLKLFLGLGPDHDVALAHAEHDMRTLAKRIVQPANRPTGQR